MLDSQFAMELPPIIPTLTSQDLKDLRYAKMLLENPGFAARMANLLGGPIEKGFALLPRGWSATVHKATKAALFRSVQVAVSTLGRNTRKRSSERFHKLLVGASGGVGGVFGLAALPIELPISTTIMLRSIADIARSEGHPINTLDTKLNCLEVFALGGPPRGDDAAESGYWAVRVTLAKTISEAASYILEKGIIEESAPAIVRLITAIASRFGTVVSEQVAAKAIPLVGAAAGSVINVLFIDHFQDMARGHFIVRRLEAQYGSEMVRDVYDSLAIPLS